MKRIWMLCCAMSAALLLSACGSSAIRSRDAARLGNVLLTGQAEVVVSVTEQAMRRRHYPELMDVSLLRAEVEGELAQRGLAAPAGTEGKVGRVVIEITDVRIRAEWVAMMWGFMAGTDRLHARVMLLEPDGRKVNHFNVMTSYAFGGFVGGASGIRVPWLYRRFAEEAVDALTGQVKVKELPPQEERNTEPRRLRF